MCVCVCVLVMEEKCCATAAKKHTYCCLDCVADRSEFEEVRSSMMSKARSLQFARDGISYASVHVRAQVYPCIHL